MSKIIQIMSQKYDGNETITALCDDGSVWIKNYYDSYWRDWVKTDFYNLPNKEGVNNE